MRVTGAVLFQNFTNDTEVEHGHTAKYGPEF